MKPIIILPPKTMSKSDIKALRDNELCVVIAKDPSQVKFLDPIPTSSSRTQMENAAIALSRKLLNGQMLQFQRGDITRAYVDILIKGSPLDPYIDLVQSKKK